MNWKTGLQAVTVALALMAPVAQAAKVAVFNPQRALEESAPAKAFEKASEARFAKQIDGLKKLETDLRKSAEKFERDAPTMTASNRDKNQMDLRRKQEDYGLQRRELEQQIAQAQQAELQRLVPKLQQAVTSVAESDGYDVVLNVGAVSYSKNNLDITTKVIARLNALAK